MPCADRARLARPPGVVQCRRPHGARRNAGPDCAMPQRGYVCSLRRNLCRPRLFSKQMTGDAQCSTRSSRSRSPRPSTRRASMSIMGEAGIDVLVADLQAQPAVPAGRLPVLLLRIHGCHRRQPLSAGLHLSARPSRRLRLYRQPHGELREEARQILARDRHDHVEWHAGRHAARRRTHQELRQRRPAHRRRARVHPRRRRDGVAPGAAAG